MLIEAHDLPMRVSETNRSITSECTPKAILKHAFTTIVQEEVNNGCARIDNFIMELRKLFDLIMKIKSKRTRLRTCTSTFWVTDLSRMVFSAIPKRFFHDSHAVIYARKQGNKVKNTIPLVWHTYGIQMDTYWYGRAGSKSDILLRRFSWYCGVFTRAIIHELIRGSFMDRKHTWTLYHCDRVNGRYSTLKIRSQTAMT